MSGAGHRVLVVDDDPFVRHLIELTLRDVCGVEIDQAADGMQAVEAARAHPPALVLLDVTMPHVDGIEACRRLRALACGPEGPPRIVMLTAAGGETERDALRAGADAFLTKPFSPRDLLELVEDLDQAHVAA